MFWYRSLFKIITIASLFCLTAPISLARSLRSTPIENASLETIKSFSNEGKTIERASIEVSGTNNLSIEDLSRLGKQITVTIDNVEDRRRNGGVIVARQNNTYTVLTTKAIIKRRKDYRLTTVDGVQYNIYDRDIKLANNNLDLAIVTFTSDRDYMVAKLGNSSEVAEGIIIYKTGYTRLLENLASDLVFTLKKATLVSILSANDSQEGYQLIDNNPLAAGSGGGAVLDDRGLLVGIQGAAFYDRHTKKSFGVSIPINYYINNKNIFTVTPNSFKTNSNN
jgi:hypothetical protein